MRAKNDRKNRKIWFTMVTLCLRAPWDFSFTKICYKQMHSNNMIFRARHFNPMMRGKERDNEQYLFIHVLDSDDARRNSLYRRKLNVSCLKCIPFMKWNHVNGRRENTPKILPDTFKHSHFFFHCFGWKNGPMIENVIHFFSFGYVRSKFNFINKMRQIHLYYNYPNCNVYQRFFLHSSCIASCLLHAIFCNTIRGFREF